MGGVEDRRRENEGVEGASLVTTTLLNGIQVSDKQIEELLGRLFEVGIPPDPLDESVTIAEAAEATRQAERDTVRRWLAVLTVESVDDSDDDDLSDEPVGSCEDCGVNIYGGHHEETIDGEYLCDQCYWARSAEQST